MQGKSLWQLSRKHGLTITKIPNREGIKCLLGVVGASLHTQDGEPGAEGLGFSCFKLPLNKNQRGLGRLLESVSYTHLTLPTKRIV